MADPLSFSPPPLSGSWLSLATEFDPERFRAMLASHPSRQHVRWWRAWPSPNIDPLSGVNQYTRGSEHRGVDRYEEMSAPTGWCVFADAGKFSKRYAPGQVAMGTIMAITMADEIPMAEGDMIAPLGRTLTQGIPDTLTRQEKRTIVHAGISSDMTGTISTSGAALTGVGTSFLSQLAQGTVIEALGETAVVESVTSDTSATLYDSFPVTLSGVSWRRRADLLPQWPATRIHGIRRDRGTVPASAYTVSPSGDRIVWLSVADMPEVGEHISVIWDYIPRYTVREVQGFSRTVPVQGRAMPQMVFLEQTGGTYPS